MKEFTTDGASGFISFLYFVFTGRKLPWEPLAVEHDRAYWQGGDLILRRLADATLERGVYEHYKQQGCGFFPTFIVPRCIYYGVRIGGQFWIPFPSLRPVNEGGTITVRGQQFKLEFSGVRWGYGYDWPRYKTG